jgi:hypothetical protein
MKEYVLEEISTVIISQNTEDVLICSVESSEYDMVREIINSGDYIRDDEYVVVETEWQGIHRIEFWSDGKQEEKGGRDVIVLDDRLPSKLALEL